MSRLSDRLNVGDASIEDVSEPAVGTQAQGNDAVRANLASMGDNGRRRRHVIHYAYRLESAGAAGKVDIEANLQERGFGLRESEQDDLVIFDHYASVAGSEFDRLTETLDRQMSQLGWGYDGWECAVIKEQETD